MTADEIDTRISKVERFAGSIFLAFVLWILFSGIILAMLGMETKIMYPIALVVFSAAVILVRHTHGAPDRLAICEQPTQFPLIRFRLDRPPYKQQAD